MIALRRPDEAVRAFLAIRRFGAFGGLIDHGATRYGDAPAITDGGAVIEFDNSHLPADVRELMLERDMYANGAARRRWSAPGKHRRRQRAIIQIA